MTCPMCRDSGMALYVHSFVTDEFWGPFLATFQAEDKIEELCIANGIDPRANWGDRCRFHEVVGPCQCKKPVPQPEGVLSMIARLRNVLPEPSFRQFEGMSLDTFEAMRDPEKARGLKAARFFAAANGTKRHSGVLLFGEPGAGKTGLMYFVYRERKKDGVIWCDYNEMLAVIHATYGKRESDTKQIMDALGHVPILFIDDMGDMSRAAPISDDGRNKTYDIIRVRHERKLMTIITSNLDQKQMRAQFGPRIYNRLRELCAWVHVGGRNLREQEHREVNLGAF